MMVDLLLKMLGENPNQFTQNIDKWIAVEAVITGKIFVVLPFILFVVCWLWIIKDKIRGKTITNNRIVKVLLVSLVIFVAGFFVPVVYDYAIAILGIRSYYGM